MQKRKNTILLIEDEAVTALYETRLLERAGYEVICHDTGQKAIEAMHASHDIDLIIRYNFMAMDLACMKKYSVTNYFLITLSTRSVIIWSRPRSAPGGSS
ncbi:MAG TPA: hypothetical protein PK926_00500 [Spirochaetota bacterium]|nr:hypothetical protein [Spirochaetota bacterium]HPI87830.1 hypothetical protein [Spirochaetota bacterium]HPR47438.1 hypothetical protein [Spirochaetota bacterium]